MTLVFFFNLQELVLDNVDIEDLFAIESALQVADSLVLLMDGIMHFVIVIEKTAHLLELLRANQVDMLMFVIFCSSARFRDYFKIFHAARRRASRVICGRVSGVVEIGLSPLLVLHEDYVDKVGDRFLHFNRIYATIFEFVLK